MSVYGEDSGLTRWRAGAIYLYERQLENMKAALFHLEAADAAFKTCNTMEHTILSDEAWTELKHRITQCETRLTTLKEGLTHAIDDAVRGDDE